VNYTSLPLPKRLPVKGSFYRVKEVPRHDPHLIDCVGRYVTEECCLYVMETMAPLQKWATLFHEWTHAITDGHPQLDISNNESAVEHVASNLMPLIKFIIEHHDKESKC